LQAAFTKKGMMESRTPCSYSTFSLSLTSTLASRLKGMYDEAQILSFKDAQGRIAYVLLRLYHNGFIDFADSGLALIRLTHQDIASLAGTSRETVTRALKSLESEGVIATRPKEVIITDPEGLEEILHGVR
jgi:CRP/FNR family transcriptional regulator, cyclic AMP receptor protein